jgi:hypothetical protein
MGMKLGLSQKREEKRLRVFGNRVLKKIFCSERVQFHEQKFHDLYSSPNKIRAIKLSTMRWEDYVERMSKKRNA